MPPTHIYAMEHDILCDDSVLFYNAAKAAGNKNIELTIWQGAFHVEQSFSKYFMNKSPMTPFFEETTLLYKIWPYKYFF